MPLATGRLSETTASTKHRWRWKVLAAAEATHAGDRPDQFAMRKRRQRPESASFETSTACDRARRKQTTARAKMEVREVWGAARHSDKAKVTV